MNRKHIIYLRLAFLSLFFLSCGRMPLYDRENTLQLALSLELDVDLDVNVPSIPVPDHFKTLFYASGSGNMDYTQFVEGTGGGISTPPGTYELLVYSFGTEYVQIRGEESLETIEAYTSDITTSKLKSLQRASGTKSPEPQLIVYTPDHLLVARETVTIPEFHEESLSITLHANAATVVQTFAFEVNGIVGCQYIESAEAYVTNQSRSYYIGRGVASEEAATLWFPVDVNREKGCLNTVFNTFGKLPGESRAILHILIRDTSGKEYHLSQDITAQFENEGNHIVIEEDVDIPAPESMTGGFSPTVEPWDPQNREINIG